MPESTATEGKSATGYREAGTFIFRTTWFNSIRTLAARLSYFHALSGNRLACLPLSLKLRAKTTTQSHRTPIYYADIVVRDGQSMEDALSIAKSIEARRTEAGYEQARWMRPRGLAWPMGRSRVPMRICWMWWKSSFLMRRILRDYESEYHFLFKRVVEASGLPGGAPLQSYCELSNLARRLLEAFLVFKVPDQKTLHARLEAVDFDGPKKTRIQRFLDTHSHAEQIGEGHDDASALGEAPEVLRDVLALIKECDERHFARMKLAIAPPV